MNERVQKRLDALFSTAPSIDIFRARSITDSYRRNEKSAQAVRMGEALYNMLRDLPVYIEEDELIVGKLTKKPRAAQLFPEVQSGWMEAEFDTVRNRPWDPLQLDEKDEKELREEIIPYWKGKTINERVFDKLPQETKEILYRNPEVYPAAPTTIIDNFSLLEKGIGTVVPNYRVVLEKGIRALIEEINTNIEGTDLCCPENVVKVEFWNGAISALEGLVLFSKRYAQEAERMAKEDDIPERRKKELMEIADVCRRVPEYPATNFHEAVQSFWFVHLMVRLENSGHSLSPGRFDQYMYPFYEMDKREDKNEWALELIECLFVKFSELMLFSSSSTSKCYTGTPQWQNLNVGGITKNGRDATNEISYLVIKAMSEVKLVQPDISVRLHQGTPDKLLIEACKLARLGTGHPKFYNDEVISHSLAAKGVTLEESRNYSVMGCVEPRISEKEGIHLTGGFINMPAGIEFVLTNGRWRLLNKQIGIKTGDPRDFKSFDEFFDAYKKQMAYLVKHLFIINAFAEQEYVRLISTPFISSLLDECRESGNDLQHGGAKYNFGPSVNMIGIADTADSLAAIKKLVFEDKAISMDELIRATEDDFVGWDDVKDKLINDAPKYGNDSDEVDYLANEAVMFVNEEIMKNKNIFGGQAQAGIIPVTSGVPFGKVMGALPNGRKANTAYADGVSPTPGMEKEGPTAVLKSVCKLDPAKLRNGILFNFRINPSVVKTDEGLKKFTSFIRTYNDLGGWHVQFNLVDTATLLDAQAHPEKYPTLLVRVAGYSAYFASLSKEIQDDLIRRVEHDL